MTNNKSVIIVAGLGRCGSSMVMKMLHHGGIPVVANNHASYETDAVSLLKDKDNTNFDMLLPGHAVKILELHRSFIPKINAKVVWIDRDEKQQALSQIKFLKFLMPGIPVSNSGVNGWIKSIRQDRAICMKKIARYPWFCLHLSFENILTNPDVYASSIASFLNLDIDTKAMAEVVEKRSAKCAPDMSMEMRLITESK